MKALPKSLVPRKAALLIATVGCCAAALTAAVPVGTHPDAPKPAHSTTVLADGGAPEEWNSTG
ncbi:hypothetical protein ACFWPQ_20035 [Streptomyces sp. NPDC058464]|uniref:hypothetical protein n=1 Tax=Streptomyces sp. NPDC058464 TaxID=3346511 RepID=UPI003654A45A